MLLNDVNDDDIGETKTEVHLCLFYECKSGLKLCLRSSHGPKSHPKSSPLVKYIYPFVINMLGWTNLFGIIGLGSTHSTIKLEI